MLLTKHAEYISPPISKTKIIYVGALLPELKGDKILNQTCHANVELSPLDHTKDTSLGVRILDVDIKYGTYYL
jgi:hypothetical protein